MSVAVIPSLPKKLIAAEPFLIQQDWAAYTPEQHGIWRELVMRDTNIWHAYEPCDNRWRALSTAGRPLFAPRRTLLMRPMGNAVEVAAAI